MSQQIKFFKNSITGNWTLASLHKVPTGLFTMSVSTDQLTVTLWNGHSSISGLVTEFYKEDGTPYANFAELDLATADFFVKALASGGGVDSISKRVITHSDGGTITVETFVGKVEVSLGYGYGYGYGYGGIYEINGIGEWDV